MHLNYETENGGVRVLIERIPFYRGWGVDFFLVDRANNTVRVATGLAWSVVTPGERTEPTFSLSDDRSQNLMDALWGAGFRPSEGTGSAGAMAAVQAHLADMRRLVFDTK